MRGLCSSPSWPYALMAVGIIVVSNLNNFVSNRVVKSLGKSSLS